MGERCEPLPHFTTGKYMSICSVFEGERRLLGVLGANVGLGGIKGGLARAQQHWTDLMPNLPSILTSVQILVALATLVYMALKIRKLLRKKNQ